jgi:hypothetical protein
VSAAINKQLIAAADIDDTPSNVRVLQHNWDRVIAARATLRGLAVAALCLTLMT